MLQNIPHQIVQSPARLGLPNPNSPSLQNNPTPPKFSTSSSQNPQTQQPQQQTPSHQTPTPPPVSSTLLPLLPPLPRAQTLLLQMSSLASKLFEVSPNRSHWISAYRGSLPSFLSSTPDSSSTSKETIMAQFTSLQSQLFEAVAELQSILDLQDSKQKLTRETKLKDTSLLSFANKLKEAENVLDTLVDDYSDYRRLKRTKLVDHEQDSSTTTVATRIKLADILSYAHKISYTTFAPPEFGAGQAPLRGALPPAPQEEQMRASQLYNFADLDVGLPKTDEGKERIEIIEPLMETVVAAVAPSIVVPEGWVPGMPVELPPRFEEMQQQLLTRPAVHAHAGGGMGRGGPEPIQVRHVELDIEHGSSDDDDGSGSSEDSSESED